MYAKPQIYKIYHVRRIQRNDIPYWLMQMFNLIKTFETVRLVDSD